MLMLVHTFTTTILLVMYAAFLMLKMGRLFCTGIGGGVRRLGQHAVRIHPPGVGDRVGKGEWNIFLLLYLKNSYLLTIKFRNFGIF